MTKEPTGLRAWLFTTDHKKIGIMYLCTALLFFVVGLLLAIVMRTEQLSQAGKVIIDAKLYNVAFTIHGAAMVLFWMIPIVLGFFANYLVPLMIGAHDVAFPRLNALSYWLYVGAGLIAVCALVLPGRLDIGWTGYPPYSIVGGANVAFYVFAVHLLGSSSIASAVNFITTIITLRAPGMTWGRLNLTVWGLLGGFIIQLVGVPVLAAAVTLLLFDKYLGTSFYDSFKGGNPLLYEHLFWFYAHPAVYVVALPVFGIVSDIISTFSRKKVYGYTSMAIAIMCITVLGFETWVHHLYVAGTLDWTRVVFMWGTILIGVPTGIKTFNWLATMHKGSIELSAPMLYALGFISLFTIGGVTGIANGLLAFDTHVHDSHWVVAHFHYVLAISMSMLCLGGIYYWFPKFTGKMYNDGLAKFAFWLTLIGAMIAFLPQFHMGYDGIPRRYWKVPVEYTTHMRIASIFSYIAIVGFILTIYNYIHSAIKGAPAPANPWGSKSLEWQIPSPPPFYNFEEIPVITEGPYEYGKPK
ncbi:MAG: cbb3-type cytochrome c oxidase subunit I [Nitrospirae bacterium]|uniref:cytochrome c oxidase subunit I n=1 Tax=Candidatus Magnetobacterium casense TaxID=1455061 RepID=UPI0005900F91|nr:cbb3-type cytochrome c oxidase subunit I [Candidatus Magnetobacterium casensis]MBF0338445.1 cbb3-type cytochrome c oxidase subunit I [Nitrospirota bacterium]